MNTEDLTTEIARLLALPLPELRRIWADHHAGIVMPRGLPRDYLVRGIADKLQTADGSLVRTNARRLEKLASQLARTGTLDIEREVSLKPGTKLIREWRGRTLRVLVLEAGYLFEDCHYASLSHVARAITGTHWSGPRFFGLKQKAKAAPGAGNV